MAVIVIEGKQFSFELNNFRRNTGTVMYQICIAKFPSYNREQFFKNAET